jgi:hypothetical protein
MRGEQRRNQSHHDASQTHGRRECAIPQEKDFMNAKSILIASAAAALCLSGAMVARTEEKMGGEQVRCAGINACMGKGACASAHNTCKGKNECKGRGITMTSAEECKAKGGTVVPKKQ